MKIVLVGDSITQGLGSKKINFVNELEKYRPEDQFINLAQSGTTIRYLKQHLEDVQKEMPEVVVIVYGNVDAQVRASTTGRLYPLIPRRFHGVSGNMLLPRPFYSHALMKNSLQHLENIMRTIFRQLIWWVDGTEQWVSIQEFSNIYREVCKVLKKQGIEVICCSTVYIDKELFPHSPEQYRLYNKEVEKAAKDYQFLYIDLYQNFKEVVQKSGWKKYYNHDHFHPNGNGYQLMAQWLNEAIQEIAGRVV